jgi:hypothetical protein
MKIRQGFVSNSSSTSFAVIIKPKGGYKLTDEDYQNAVDECEISLEEAKRLAEDFDRNDRLTDYDRAWEIMAIFDRYMFQRFSINVYSDYGEVKVIYEDEFKAQVESVLKSIKE